MDKSKEEAALIQKAIEKCFTLYLTRAEIMITLQNQFNVNPEFSENLLNSVEQNNPSFFKVYYQRLRIKQQIQEFNHLSSLIIKNSNFSSTKSITSNSPLNINLNNNISTLPNYSISTPTTSSSQTFHSQDTTLTPHLSQDSIHSSTSSVTPTTPITSNTLFPTIPMASTDNTATNHEILQNLMIQLQQNNNDQFASLSNNTNSNNILTLNTNTTSLDLNNNNNNNNNSSNNNNAFNKSPIANTNIDDNKPNKIETTVSNPMNEFLIYDTTSPNLTSNNNNTIGLPASFSGFMDQQQQQIPNLNLDFNFNFTQSSNKIPIPSLNQSCDFDSFLNLKQE